jgi:hypothetical protein
LNDYRDCGLDEPKDIDFLKIIYLSFIVSGILDLILQKQSTADVHIKGNAHLSVVDQFLPTED